MKYLMQALMLLGLLLSCVGCETGQPVEREQKLPPAKSAPSHTRKDDPANWSLERKLSQARNILPNGTPEARVLGLLGKPKSKTPGECWLYNPSKWMKSEEAVWFSDDSFLVFERRFKTDRPIRGKLRPFETTKGEVRKILGPPVKTVVGSVWHYEKTPFSGLQVWAYILIANGRVVNVVVLKSNITRKRDQ